MKTSIIILLSLLIVIKSYSNKNITNDYQTGDLIFTSPDFSEDDSGFSNAINDVTQTGRYTSYTHVGIVEVDKPTVWVIHASPEKGVVKELLEDFLKNAKKASVYRLKNNSEIIPQVIKNAHKFLGILPIQIVSSNFTIV